MLNVPPYLRDQYQLLQQQDGPNPMAVAQGAAAPPSNPYQSYQAASMGTPSTAGQAFQPPAQRGAPQMLQAHQQHQVVNPQNHRQGSNNVYNYAQANQPLPQQYQGPNMAPYQAPAPAQYGTPGGTPVQPVNWPQNTPGGGYNGSQAPGPLPGNPGYNPQANDNGANRFPEFINPGSPDGQPPVPGPRYQNPAASPGQAPVPQPWTQPAAPPGQPAAPQNAGGQPPGQPAGNPQQAEISRLNQQIAETQAQLSQMGNIRSEVQQTVQNENAHLRQQLETIQQSMQQQEAAQRAAQAQAARARLAQNLNPEAMADLDAYINNTVAPQAGQQANAQVQQMQQQYDTRINELQQQIQQSQQQTQQTQEQMARARATEMRTRLLADHQDLDLYMKGANNHQWDAYLMQPIAPGSTITRQMELDQASKDGNTQRISQMISDYKMNSGQYYPPQNAGQIYSNGNGNGHTYDAYQNGNGQYQVPPQQGYQNHNGFQQQPDPFLGQSQYNPYQQVNPIKQGMPTAPYVNPTGHLAPGQTGGFTQPSHSSYTPADLQHAAQQITKHSNDPQQQAYWSQKYNDIERFFTQQAGPNTSILPPIN